MSVATLAPDSSIDLPWVADCRVYERFSCDLAASCQPIAARSDNDIVWPGMIRDISEGGVGLVLARRYERGAALAIELPGRDGRPRETLFAKVVHTTPWPGNRWLLGCSFISRLSEEEVRFVIELAASLRAAAQCGKEWAVAPASSSTPPRPAASPAPSSQPERAVPTAESGASLVMTNLWFEGLAHDGQTVRVPVRRLFLTGVWPLPAGTTLRLWAGDRKANPAGIQVEIVDCREQSDGWTVKYQPVQPVSADDLRQLGFSG